MHHAESHTSHQMQSCVLVFSHISERDGVALLLRIAATLKESHVNMQYLVITTYNQKSSGQTCTGGFVLSTLSRLRR